MPIDAKIKMRDILIRLVGSDCNYEKDYDLSTKELETIIIKRADVFTKQSINNYIHSLIRLNVIRERVHGKIFEVNLKEGEKTLKSLL